MRKTRTMRWISRALAVATMGGVLLGLAPQASAQRPGRRIVIVQPAPIYDPFFYGPYPYPPAYESRNYGYLKLDTHHRDGKIYVDGGYAAETKKNKEFALQPGNHDIELRDSEGRTFFQQRVAVMVGHTTKVDVQG